MSRRLVALFAMVAFAVGLAGPAAPTAVGYTPSKVNLSLVPVATGLSSPVLVTTAKDGSGRLFIVEKTGRIKILKGGSVLAQSFLNISGSVSKGGEQGLLGLAFHPQFKTNRKLYVNYTDLNGDTRINEYHASATTPDIVQTGFLLLKVDQPYDNHNGGNIAFGPDGYLYIGLGDGGAGGDPGNRAQRLDTLLGKMLRIDVNGKSGTKAYRIRPTNPYVGKSGLDEIWSRGLRNPWRWSFDRLTGALWIGDVGQERWEEIDRSLKTASGAGRAANYGWKVMEGRHCFSPSSGCSLAGDTLPVAEYFHQSDRCSVTGGFVYRGSAYPDLYGAYLFADYCTGEIWAINAGAGTPGTAILELNTSLFISSFGEDEVGNLYVTDLRGGVYRIRDS